MINYSHPKFWSTLNKIESIWTNMISYNKVTYQEIEDLKNYLDILLKERDDQQED